MTDRNRLETAPISHRPLTVAWLGYGGLLLHWGFAMVHPAAAGPVANKLYIWSVVPSLLGWVALLIEPAVGAALLIAGFLVHYGQDLRLTRIVPLPSWYLPLRLQLTAVACLCLASVYFSA